MITSRQLDKTSSALMPRSPLARALLGMILLLLAIRVAFIFTGTILPDETYYWMWSQHPAISYYDHPPLNAWTLWLSSKLFGWNVFALRIVPIITFVGDLWVLWLISRVISDDPKSHFFVTALLFLSTPIFLTMSMLALPDHLLIFCLLLSLYFFLKFFAKQYQGSTPSWTALYLACMMLGFATLAKYNAVLLGAGVFAYAIFETRARQLFVHWQAYAAFSFFLLVVSPEIYWNIATKASSVTFVLQDRHAGLPTDNNFEGLKGFLGGMVAFLSPFLIWPLLKTLLSKPSENTQSFVWLGRAIFLVSTLVFLGLSLTTDILFHWNLVAYIAILPFVALYMRARWLALAHILYGTMVAALIAFNFAVLPLRTYFSSADYFSARAYGWEETAIVANKLAKEHNVGFIAGTHYTSSSPLGFALKNPNVTDLGSSRSQYRFWFQPEAHLGQDALILTTPFEGVSGSLKARFDEFTPLQTFEVYSGEKLVEKRQFYLAKDFKG